MLRQEIDRILGTGFVLRLLSDGWFDNRGDKQQRLEQAVRQAIERSKPDPFANPDADDRFAEGFNLAIELFERNLLRELSRE